MEDAPDRKRPSITSVINAELPGQTSAGRTGQIIKTQGNRLSFDPADEELGVFLVATDGNAHRMAVYSRNGTARVNLKLPIVPVGTYSLEVRTRPSHNDVWVGIARDLFAVKS